MTHDRQDYSGGALAVKILKPKWGWIFFSGLMTFVFGVLAFIMPFGAIYAMTILFGAYAMADGVLSVLSAVRKEGSASENFWPLMLRGALGIFTGIIVLVMPVFSALSLVIFAWVMLALWSITTGVLELLAAIRLRAEIEGEWMLGLLGLVSLAFGIAIPILLWFNPAAGVVTMGWMIGFYAVLHGIVEMGLGFSLRKLQH